MANLPSSWKEIKTIEQLNEAIDHSENKPTVLFKHSVNCSISGRVRSNLERDWNIDSDVASFYYIDLINHRDVSNAIQDTLGVHHQSPQVIVVKNKRAEYNEAHFDVNFGGIKDAIL